MRRSRVRRLFPGISALHSHRPYWVSLFSRYGLVAQVLGDKKVHSGQTSRMMLFLGFCICFLLTNNSSNCFFLVGLLPTQFIEWCLSLVCLLEYGTNLLHLLSPTILPRDSESPPSQVQTQRSNSPKFPKESSNLLLSK
jgi:hypothetical protein